MNHIVIPSGSIRLRSSVKSDEIWFGISSASGFSFSGAVATITPSGLQTAARPYGISLVTISKRSKFIALLLRLLSIGFFLTYIVLGIINTKEYRIFFSLCFLFSAIRELSGGLAIFLPRLFGSQEMKNFSKLFGAKNAVENAFYSLGRIPTIDEAKRFSILCFYNPYMDFSSSAITPAFLVFSIVTYFSFCWALALFIGITVVSFILLKKLDCGFTVLASGQFLTVSRPKDMHFKVAIEALTSARDNALANFSETCENCGYYEVCKSLNALK